MAGETVTNASALSDRANVLGLGISAINMPRALATMDEWISRREPCYVTVGPAHAMWDGHRQDP